MLAVTPIGLTELGALFRIDRPWTACRICGRVYQTDLDRVAVTPVDIKTALVGRQDWSFKHARTHPQHMHDSLEKSGAFMTPEAAYRLASFGIISLSDMALNEESWNAGREALRAPLNDSEG